MKGNRIALNIGKCVSEYKAEWLNVLTGERINAECIANKDGISLFAPPDETPWLLKLQASCKFGP